MGLLQLKSTRIKAKDFSFQHGGTPQTFSEHHLPPVSLVLSSPPPFTRSFHICSLPALMLHTGPCWATRVVFTSPCLMETGNISTVVKRSCPPEGVKRERESYMRCAASLVSRALGDQQLRGLAGNHVFRSRFKTRCCTSPSGSAFLLPLITDQAEGCCCAKDNSFQKPKIRGWESQC